MPETALHKAARDGSIEEVQELVASGALDINEKGAQGACRFARPELFCPNFSVRPSPRGKSLTLALASIRPLVIQDERLCIVASVEALLSVQCC